MSDRTTTPGDCPIETATEGGWFGITTAEDFFRKVCTDYERALNDIADPYAAMNCILSLYHLHEWVWWCWLKGRDDVLSALDIREMRKIFAGCSKSTARTSISYGSSPTAPNISASKNANESITLNVGLDTATGHMELALGAPRIFSLIWERMRSLQPVI